MARKRKAPEMGEPILHGIPGRMLPDDHFLNVGGDIHCDHCDITVYTPEAGTIVTWVETGIYLDLGDIDPATVTRSTYTMYCVACFAQFGDAYPVMDTRYAFNSGDWDPPGGEYTQELAREGIDSHPHPDGPMDPYERLGVDPPKRKVRNG